MSKKELMGQTIKDTKKTKNITKKEYKDIFKIQDELDKQNMQHSPITQEEKLKHVKEWTTFYRRNLDVYVTDYLKIKNLAYLQRIMLITMGDNSQNVTLCSRELGKSHMVSLFAICMATLYSNCNIGVVSFTINQANSIIEEKIKGVFCNPASQFYSPILGQLVADGYMTFSTNSKTKGEIVSFANGSKIEGISCLESSRGLRETILIVDEFVLLKKQDYETICHPMLANRDIAYRAKGDYPDEFKEIFLSSAKKKTNWGWTFLKKDVIGHFKNKDYGFFIADCFTAVASGINTPKQIQAAKDRCDDYTFMQEYLNIWLGSSSSSLFTFEDFERNQVIKKPFYPKDDYELLDENNTSDYKFGEDDIRILAVDFAVAMGNKNDNASLIMGAYDTKKGVRRVEYVNSYNGLPATKQVILYKRLFYEYKAKYFCFDTTGSGNVLYDMFTQPTVDDVTGEVYPAWTVCTDPLMQIVSDSVQNDKIKRTVSDDAEPVIVPIVGTATLNTELHLALRKNLREGRIHFLIDDSDAEANLENDSKLNYITLPSKKKAEMLQPFLQTRFMINESVSVEAQVKDNGNIKMVEARSATKDLFMALDYWNFVSNKVALKYKRNDEDSQSNFNINDWSFLASINA